MVHASISNSPFEIFFGYVPLSLEDVVYGYQGGVREETLWEALKVEKFVDKIK